MTSGLLQESLILRLNYNFAKETCFLAYSKSMDWQIRRPANANPNGPYRLPVVDYFTEKLKTTNVALAPEKYELSGNPSKALGEEAERTVIDYVKKCNIPGIKIICFHGVRVIGGNPSILREVDLCCFVFYQDRF